MYKPYENDDPEWHGWYGIVDERGGVLYDGWAFDDLGEAQAFADAHNNGAQSYEQAYNMVHGLPAEPDTVTDSIRAVLGEGPEVGTAAWYDSLPMIDPETGETENS